MMDPAGLSMWKGTTNVQRIGGLGEYSEPFNDGRGFRIAKNGAVALSVGKVAVEADDTALHQNLAVQANAAIGAKLVYVTLGAAALLEDQYAQGGYLEINDGAGESYMYRINYHPAMAGAGTLAVYLRDPLQVAVTSAASKASLKMHHFSDIQVALVDGLDRIVGVPNAAIAASEYFRAQTHGPCKVLADGAWLRGDRLYLSGSVAGALTADLERAVAAGLKPQTIQPSWSTKEAGDPIVKFVNAGADGFQQVSDEELYYRWNNTANPPEVAFMFILPENLDTGSNIVAHFLGAPSSTNDSPVLTVQAFFSQVGVAPAGDADCGGSSTEFAASALLQEKTLTIAAADVPASPSMLTLIVNPKDGELATDDFLMAVPWLEVKVKEPRPVAEARAAIADTLYGSAYLLID